ncbi:MAG: HAMP domain-containing histidine kinase [Ruminococcus sp.]|nr:HAMP domain-containing histidine kinase [Ruminococcus sp.]
MKKFVKTLIAITVFFAVLGIVSELIVFKAANRSRNSRNIAVNRINRLITEEVAATGAYPEDMVRASMEEWQREYGKSAPIDIEYIPLFAESRDVPVYVSSDGGAVICTLMNGDELFGFVRYSFDNKANGAVRRMIIVIVMACWLAAAAVVVYIHYVILMPFRQFADYPERLAKLGTTEKLPESRNKYFGKFVWGMNMLSDVLESNTRKIHELENQRQTLLASIAHGIKTPVTNIRLYAEAIRTGLYNDSGDGSANNDIAGKIERNTEDIEKKITEMINTAATSVSDFEPVNERFYLKELAELTKKEFSERLRISRVNFSIECEENPMLCSDKYGIFRILSQFIENAVKYGDGSSLKVTMGRQDEGFFFSVRNKGELLPAKEMPFIFKCYWRGSNSTNKSGSGIGLYAAKEIAHCLGGSVYAQRHEQTSEMEFVLYIE